MNNLFRMLSAAAVGCLFILTSISSVFAFDYGSIDSNRLPPAGWEDVQWVDPGGWMTINVTENGLPANDSSVDASQKIIDILNGSSGRRILYFPQGVYYLETNLLLNANLISGDLIIKGDGSDKTELVITAPGAANAEIKFEGNKEGLPIAVSGSPAAGDQTITVSDASTLNAGDFIQLYADQAPLESGGWAWGNNIYGQIFKIISKSSNTLTLDMKMGLPYPSSYVPMVQKLNMLENVGVENIKIYRSEMPTTYGKSNIRFHHVYNAYVKDIESERAEMNHIYVSTSKKVVIERNKLHESLYIQYSYGYGVNLGMGTTGSRVTDNKLWNLRHQIILQSGANHNVVSYNSVEETYQSYNDVALHATYAYMNLFEGNRFQEGYADTSKDAPGSIVEGQTGPGNTWFRNNALSYVGSIQSNTEKQNIIGNYLGSISSGGSDHYIGANKRRDGTILWGVLSSESALPSSLYLESKPVFFDSKPWPIFGPGADAYWGEFNTLQATDRLKSAGHIIVDNNRPGDTGSWGTWTTSTWGTQKYGSNYVHDGNDHSAIRWFSFKPQLENASYAVYVWWTESTNRATNAVVITKHGGTREYTTVNQQINGGQWVYIGTYAFTSEKSDNNAVYIKNQLDDGTWSNGYVVADAVKFVKQ
ncbi:golvesin C-terminal-like domain-containing protein [Paenibacillus soyae]|uniref:Golvesin/Xly CBD-like domain-containing protein n=1 Tax=Paenibacillus soyae TaxID=2969249 RepID=A0A9X2S9G8_9BACL|nr:hypothetical protein [Paenibacillus soyae]MCR2805429.1 hypothetical protein [Paenibacillus soyae]